MSRKDVDSGATRNPAFIKPCPWCGSDKCTYSGSNYFWVSCRSKKCAAEGPIRKTAAGAILAWNKGIAR